MPFRLIMWAWQPPHLLLRPEAANVGPRKFRPRSNVAALPSAVESRTRASTGRRRPCRDVRRLENMPRLPRGVLQAVVHVVPRAGHAALHAATSAARTSTLPDRRDCDRQEPIPGGNRRSGRAGSASAAGRREDLPDRARDGREERLLLPHAAGARALAGIAGGLRRPQEGLVRHGGQRRAPLSRPPRRGPRTGPIGCSPSTPLASIATSANCARTTILAGDTYKTTWSEPGISCESCHGPGKRAPPSDGRRGRSEDKSTTSRSSARRNLRPKQMNDMCATCHAKLVPLSLDFLPGDKFLRPFRPRRARSSRLLSRRPRPGRELHLHVLDDEPVRALGQARLQPLPYPKRPAAIRGQRKTNKSCTPVSSETRRRPRFPRASCARQQRERLHRMPHAHDAIRRHGPNRSLHVAADARGHHRFQVAECLQPLPCRQGRRLVRCLGSEVVSTRLSGPGHGTGVAAGRRPKRRLETPSRNAGEDRAVRRKTPFTRLRWCGLFAAVQDESKWPVLVKALGDRSPLVRSSAASALAGHLNGETIPAVARRHARSVAARAYPGGDGVGAHSRRST